MKKDLEKRINMIQALRCLFSAKTNCVLVAHYYENRIMKKKKIQIDLYTTTSRRRPAYDSNTSLHTTSLLKCPKDWLKDIHVN